MDVKTFKENAKKQPWKTVNGLCVQDGETIKFERNSGRYLSEKHVIKGISDKQRPVEIQLDDMRFINVRPQPTAANKIVKVTATTVILGGFLLLLLSNVELDYDVM
ncbi:MAG: hypothetical protein V3V99_04760 [candidate division Zixibacteria bacterium]